ncbi:MAG: hypothetical protein P8179_15480 [Candidatus Thiodiazotropha sp.]
MAWKITESVLEEAEALNVAGDVAGAYQVLAEAGDFYSQGAQVVIEEINAPVSIFARIVQVHWDRVVPGARQRVFMDVGKLHQKQYLELIRPEKSGLDENGEQLYLLPNSIQIENSYREALLAYDLPALTTVDSMFSLIDRNLELGEGPLYAAIRNTGVVDITWAHMLNPELEDTRIRYDSDVFINDPIEPFKEIVKTVAALLMAAYEQSDVAFKLAALELFQLVADAIGDVLPQMSGLEEPQATSLTAGLLLSIDDSMTDERMMRILDALTLGDNDGHLDEIRDLEWLTRNIERALTGTDPGPYADKEELYAAATNLLMTISSNDALNYKLIDLFDLTQENLANAASQDNPKKTRWTA